MAMNRGLRRLSVQVAPACLLAIAVLALPVVANCGVPASRWAFSSPLPDSLAQLRTGSGPLLLDLWQACDLRYDRGRDGCAGTLAAGFDVVLRNADDLEQYARVEKVDGPLHRTDAIEVEVLSAGGERWRRIGSNDLVWRGGMANEGGGVLFLDVKAYSAVLPGLRVGDRLRVVRRDELRGAHGIPMLDLRGSGAAWRRAHLEVRVPGDHRLVWEAVGSDSLRRELRVELGEERGQRVGRWELCDDGVGDKSDVASLRVVPHVTLPDDAARMDAFAARADWSRAAEGYLARIGPLLAGSDGIREVAAEVTAGVGERADKINALCRHVQAATRYLGLFEGLGGIIPEAAEATRRNGYGDCKGLSVFLASLCRAAEIEAWPVLVRTRHLGPLAADTPNMAQFNHCIVWADDGRGGCWLDPTLDGVPAGIVTVDDAASPVLLLRPGSAGLGEIPAAAWAAGRHVFVVAGELDAALRLVATVSLRAEGPGGAVLRAQLGRETESARTSALRRLLLSPAAGLDGGGIATSTDSTRATVWSLAVRGDRPLSAGGGRAFVPSELATLSLLRSGALPERSEYDLRSRPDRDESWQLTLPPGWSLAAADSFVLTSPGMTWRRATWQEGSTLHLHREILWSPRVLKGDDRLEWRRTVAAAVARERKPVMIVQAGQAGIGAAPRQEGDSR
jgi:hypothetical protein